MTTKKILFIAIIFTGMLFTSCSSDDDGPATTTLTINILNLNMLEGNVVYKAWIRTNSNTIELGTFQDVDFPKNFEVVSDELDAATDFFITIEDNTANSNTPSSTRIASARLSTNSNTAQISSVDAIGDFSSISGSFVLRTFTGSAPSNEPNGIWFTNELSATTNLSSALSLPTLNPGWKYEAWVVLSDRNGNNVNLSLGKFSDTSQSDENDIFSGQGDAPQIPGEDFLNTSAGNLINIAFPADITNRNVFITVEPENGDNSNEPFDIQVLSTNNATANQVNTMSTNNFFITGTLEK